MHEAIDCVNGEKIAARTKNIWEMPYFTTSETEDNDTEESDKEDNFENNQEYAMLKARETIAVQYNLSLNEQEESQIEKFDEYKERT